MTVKVDAKSAAARDQDRERAGLTMNRPECVDNDDSGRARGTIF